MLTAYLDESSDGAQKKIFVTAGFVGRYEAWEGVEWRWEALLEEYGLKYYRAYEAEHAEGQFSKLPFRTSPDYLTPAQRILLREVRDEFLSILCNGRIFGLAVGIPMKDFYSVACTAETLDKFGDTPYYLCGHLAMLMGLEGTHDELRSKEVIRFFFDRNSEHQKEMERVHEEFAAKNPIYKAQIGTVKFDSKENTILLQTADTLAYEVRKDFELRIMNPTVPERVELQRLKDAHRIYKISLCEVPCLNHYLDSHPSNLPKKGIDAVEGSM